MTTSRRKITLHSGWVVSLESLEQWAVYASLLEGLPTRELNDRVIERAALEARRRDGHDPFVVAPVQKPIEHEGRYPFGQPVTLPAIGCVARLHSHAPARNPDLDCSDLTVIWFQDEYAFPLSAEAEQAILDLDWKRLARDGEY